MSTLRFSLLLTVAGILLLTACESVGPSQPAAIVERLSKDSQRTTLVVLGQRRSLERRFPNSSFISPEEARQNVDCTTVLCDYFVATCEVFIYWDDDGDGEADGFECSYGPEPE